MAKSLKRREMIMKIAGLFVLVAFLTVAGVTLAQQSGNEKKNSSMQDMMQHMMKQKQSGEGGMEGMGGMMGMMKMMEQCSYMMKSMHQPEKSKESQNK
jgi:hypothetical protein